MGFAGMLKTKLKHGLPDAYPADNTKLLCSAGVVDAVCELGEFKTAYDFGAGTGIYVLELLKKGVRAIGIELNEKDVRVEPENWLVSDVGLDLTEELKLVDLCLSVECAEHIDKRVAGVFARNLTMLSRDTIIMTASNEEGKYHVNTQPMRYWIELIERYGRHRHSREESIELRKKLAEVVKGFGQKWFGETMMVFRRVK